MAKLELYGTSTCPFTEEMREWLEWRRCEFSEYDVEADPDARHRIRTLAGEVSAVPILVEDGKVIQVGWNGRSCMVNFH